MRQVSLILLAVSLSSRSIVGTWTSNLPKMIESKGSYTVTFDNSGHFKNEVKDPRFWFVALGSYTYAGNRLRLQIKSAYGRDPRGRVHNYGSQVKVLHVFWIDRADIRCVDVNTSVAMVLHRGGS